MPHKPPHKPHKQAPPRGRAQPVEGRVRDVVPGGDSVIETAEGIVFTRGALPGERVTLALDGARRGAKRGRILAIVEASAHRTSSACDVADACGGCPWIAFDVNAANERKRKWLADAVAKHAVQGVEVGITAGANTLGYRRRSRLAWERRGAQISIGYRASSSHSIVDVKTCAVLLKALDASLAALRERIAPLLQGSGDIELAIGEDEQPVLQLHAAEPHGAGIYTALEKLVTDRVFVGVAFRVGGAENAPATWGAPAQEHVGVDGLALHGRGDGFVQVNGEVNAALVTQVVAWAEPAGAEILELYAGHGNFTVELAKHAKGVTAIELDRAQCDSLQENLRLRGLTNVRVRVGDAGPSAKGAQVDVIVLDPPRTGARDAIDAMVARKPLRIVYVSCDLPTLARDLALLGDHGYRVDAAQAFDMFPRTGHLESVVRLSRQIPPSI